MAEDAVIVGEGPLRVAESVDRYEDRKVIAGKADIQT
jgi:hypothetical protein